MSLDRFNKGVDDAIGSAASGFGRFLGSVGKFILFVFAAAWLIGGTLWSLALCGAAAYYFGWAGLWAPALGAVLSPLWFFTPLWLVANIYNPHWTGDRGARTVSQYRYVAVIAYLAVAIVIFVAVPHPA
jgi:hypothetical protein